MSPGVPDATLDPDRYRDHLGVAPAAVAEPSRDALASLQAAHVTTVPFENLAIVGDPATDGDDGPGVDLALPHLFAKVVERGRGGYCFELNGLFGWLLAELGFDVTRVPGRVLGDDGEAALAANHHPLVVALDRRVLVDVGTGVPQPREPVPLDGEAVTDAAGVGWRVDASDRPDATYRLAMRPRPDADWETRYVFDDEPWALADFASANDHLQTSPDSPFTGSALAALSTDSGYRKLSGGTLTVVDGDDRTERSVPAAETAAVLGDAFGLDPVA